MIWKPEVGMRLKIETKKMKGMPRVGSVGEVTKIQRDDCFAVLTGGEEWWYTRRDVSKVKG